MFGFTRATEWRLRVEFLTEQLTASRDEARYWKARAEKLMDAALARAGAIHEPTMRESPRPNLSPSALLTAAMAVQEIDSSNKP